MSAPPLAPSPAAEVVRPLLLARYVAGAGLGRLADEGARVCLVLLAIDSGHGAGLGGLLVGALMLPHVLAAPAVGVLTDRARGPQHVAGAGAAGFAVALAATAALLGRVPHPVTIAVLVAGGCCGPALTGALTSHLANLVPEHAVPRAFGLDSLTYNIAGIGGPAVAALVSGLVSPEAATYVLAGLAGLGALAIVTLPTGRRHDRPEHEAAPTMTAGLRAVRESPLLATVTLASTLEMVTYGALPVVAAVLATSVGERTAGGWLMTAVAAGALLGSLAWTVRPLAARHAPAVVMTGLVATAAPIALAALVPRTAPALVVVGLLFALSGLASGPFMGALFTARQTLSPPHVRAQVFTLGAGLRTTAGAGGAVVAGAISGTPTALQLLVTGGYSLAGGAVGFAVLRRTRHSPRRAAA
ncbi:MFS transporter [Motilibacter peucedani]|uniref:MFS transporter n=1 Tax=Motilibacter peucedani TaxID=598650 RepID=A0A420XUK7_9ACTN|nr:MFS transporter [Motilibacter peucedani]RKS80447.1 MFS transporter [Motilibacter peucedani]